MSYQIPTEEVENIRRERYGDVILTRNKQLKFYYEDSTGRIEHDESENEIEIFFEWNSHEDTNDLNIGSLNAKESSFQEIKKVYQIIEAIAKLLHDEIISANIVNLRLQKIVCRIGFERVKENRFEKKLE